MGWSDRRVFLAIARQSVGRKPSDGGAALGALQGRAHSPKGCCAFLRPTGSPAMYWARLWVVYSLGLDTLAIQMSKIPLGVCHS